MVKRYLKFLVFLSSLLPSLLPAGTFNTFAAWADTSVPAVNRGYIYVYTGSVGATVQLFDTNNVNTTINNLLVAPGFIGAYQPAIAYGPIVMASPQKYFRLQTDNTVVWEIEEDLQNPGDDSHDMLAAADTGRYRGEIFMTYLRAWAANVNYGDAIAVFNPTAVTITVEVLPWTGAVPLGAWGAAIANSPVIPAGGIWMWSPDQDAAKRNGGTLIGNENHYQFNISGGEGFLWKGNSFNFYSGGACPPQLRRC